MAKHPSEEQSIKERIPSLSSLFTTYVHELDSQIDHTRVCIHTHDFTRRIMIRHRYVHYQLVLIISLCTNKRLSDICLVDVANVII